MCLAVPAKLVEREGDKGKVEIGGAKIDISLALLDNANIGDYLLVHAGYALDRVDEEEARKTLELFEQVAREGKVSCMKLR